MWQEGARIMLATEIAAAKRYEGSIAWERLRDPAKEAAKVNSIKC